MGQILHITTWQLQFYLLLLDICIELILVWGIVCVRFLKHIKRRKVDWEQATQVYLIQLIIVFISIGPSSCICRYNLSNGSTTYVLTTIVCFYFSRFYYTSSSLYSSSVYRWIYYVWGICTRGNLLRS